MARSQNPRSAGLALNESEDAWVLLLSGDWTTDTVAQQDAALRILPGERTQPAVIDLSEVQAFDTAGAWLVARTVRRLEAAGVKVQMDGADAARQALIDKAMTTEFSSPPAHTEGLLLALLARLGQATVKVLGDGRDLLSFLGLTVVRLARLPFRPSRLSGTALVSHMERTGFDALPIVGLLSFLIGVVMAYQGAEQLARFGAQIFVVDLVGIAVLREMGILITAIIVAGRSGSAFTAQIGTMRVNQEIDAMRTIGLDPIELLVLPRVIALVLVMPLLTFYANLLGLAGGALTAFLILDVGPVSFVRQLHHAVDVSTFMVGMVKAPLFAFIIALVGCFEGLKVTSNAESVGLHTTRAVVKAIFLVIVLDALFSVFFSIIGV